MNTSIFCYKTLYLILTQNMSGGKLCVRYVYMCVYNVCMCSVWHMYGVLCVVYGVVLWCVVYVVCAYGV